MASDLRRFYEKSNVLITGGAGYFGKLLLQKLLASFEDIGEIYVIVRGKKDKTARQRMNESFQHVLFDKLRKQRPNFKDKIVVLEGDCTQTNLGLTEAGKNLVVEKINVVFHCAASLNVEATLKEAVDANLRSTRHLLDVCREMKNVKSFLFVSTAYSHLYLGRIEEKLYDVPHSPESLIELVDRMEKEDNVIEDFTSNILGKWSNTHCFTKALAENLCTAESDKIPVGIFRPSTVMPTLEDPVVGWCENLNGPVGLMLSTGVGIVRTVYTDKSNNIDLVPADFCVNAMICCAWEIFDKRRSETSQVPVYNFAAGVDGAITAEKFYDAALNYKYPAKNPLWATFMVPTKCFVWFRIMWLLFHTLPGLLIDAYRVLRNKKPRMLKTYDKIYKLMIALVPFNFHRFDFVHENTDALRLRLCPDDRQTFFWDMKTIDWENYIMNCCTGIKVYVLNEPLDDFASEIGNYKKLLLVHNACKAVLIFALLWGFYHSFLSLLSFL